MPLNQQAKKEGKVMAVASDPDYQREIGRLLHNVRKVQEVPVYLHR